VTQLYVLAISPQTRRHNHIYSTGGHAAVPDAETAMVYVQLFYVIEIVIALPCMGHPAVGQPGEHTACRTGALGQISCFQSLAP
jgi:hypothetical protein